MSATQTQLEHAPGSFCWIELATTDAYAAKQFYSEMFGWEGTDTPISEEMVYTTLKLNGKDVGALYEIRPEDRYRGGKGVPTQWFSYISVTSADETAAKAKALGGTVLREPFDVMEHGRMAIIADPTGAHFCIWQAKQHKGIGVKGETGSLCWNELLTNDTERAKDFYTKLFGWNSKTDSGETPYTEWINGEEHIGGMMEIQPFMGPRPPQWAIYIAVDDCDAKVEKAESGGATTSVPPTDIPKVGRFAELYDPTGGTFNIIKLSAEHHQNQ